jgi:hypothetical protein
MGILASVLIIPTSQADLSPAFIFQFHNCMGLAPSLWLFEGKTVSVDARAASATVGARFPVQNPVAPKADKNPTRLIL